MIYLDHHAATPLAPAVRAAMLRAQEQGWANPASVHGAGRASRALVEEARRALAATVGAEPSQVVFTAGGTEACNLAVLGLLGARAGARARNDGEVRGGAAECSRARPGPLHVVTSELEHPAIAAAIASLEQGGAAVERLPIAGAAAGPPAPEMLARALRPETALAALQWVNHETGAVAPVEGYARVCRAQGVPLVVDASQALGKVPCDVAALGAAAVVFAASKIGGPAGAAALCVERGRELAPRLFGGAQERGRRAGTPDVAALAGFGAAALQVGSRLAAMPRIAALRDRLERACVELGAIVNGPWSAPERVATVTNVSVRGWRGEVLVAALDLEGLCASSGAACSSGLGAPSPVLLALYPGEPWRAESALRLSLGPETSDAEVDHAIAILRRVLGRAG